MANLTYGLTWTADTIGILSKTTVRIKAIEFIANTAGDAAVLSWWDKLHPTTGGDRGIKATITSTTTFTDPATGGLLTAARYPALDVLEIITSDGAAANVKEDMITTSGDNNVIICAGAVWTNEATKNYRINSYPKRVAIPLLSQATTKKGDYIFFGDKGVIFPNLMLTSISSASDVLVIHMAF